MPSTIASMKVTVQTVADAAAVSLGTVSRVLRGDPSVSSDNRKRVHAAVKRLGYRPLRQRKGRSEAMGLRDKTIALLTLGLDRTLAELPVVASVMHGIQDGLAKEKARLMLVNCPEVKVIPRNLLDENIAGVLVKGAMQGDVLGQADPRLLKWLDSRPCVWFLGRPSGAPGDVVGVNDWEVGALAARHLIEKGHRRLAFLSPKPGHALFERRQAGFKSEARMSGASVKSFLSAEKEWKLPLKPANRLESVQRLVDRVLRMAERPSAVFVPADSVAVVVYRALAERGLKVGRDISLISANNELPLLNALFPSLTTIDVQSERIGELAVKQLRQRFSDDSKTIERNLDPLLVEGGSVSIKTKK